MPPPLSQKNQFCTYKPGNFFGVSSSFGKLFTFPLFFIFSPRPIYFPSSSSPPPHPSILHNIYPCGNVKKLFTRINWFNLFYQILFISGLRIRDQIFRSVLDPYFEQWWIRSEHQYSNFLITFLSISMTFKSIKISQLY